MIRGFGTGLSFGRKPDQQLMFVPAASLTLSEAKLQLLIRLSTKRKPGSTASLYQKLYGDLSRNIVVRIITSTTKPAHLKEAVLLLLHLPFGRSLRIKLVSRHRRSDMAAPTSALEWSAANILD